MKRKFLLVILTLSIAMSAAPQQRLKGTILLGGSIGSQNYAKGSWQSEGTIESGIYLFNNFAVGSEIYLYFDKMKEFPFYYTLSPYVFARYHVPFFTPIFAQLGIGSPFSHGSFDKVFWCQQLGVDFKIGPGMVIELSCTRFSGFDKTPANFSTNIGLIALLNVHRK